MRLITIVLSLSYLLCTFSSSLCAVDGERNIYEERFKYLPGGRYYYFKVPPHDPIAVLSDEDQSAYDKKPKKFKFAKSIPSYVDRIEAHYVPKQYASSDFIQWLGENPKIRTAFWLAINPRYDYPEQCIQILDKLRIERTKSCEKFYHLAIAAAVVADSPHAIASSRNYLVWGIKAEQQLSMPDVLEIFDYYTDAKHIKRMQFKPDQLVWPLLMNLIDFDLNKDERNWTIKKFSKQVNALDKSYSMIDYDYDKLNKKPRLGSKPYSMENIYNPSIGGVCVDQAHCASRVMKCFGIPALKVRGDGRFGGNGHAWTGYLSKTSKGLAIEFTGRYLGDYYWTGDSFDPQTESIILDRHLAMMLDGALKGYGKYIESSALTRMAKKCQYDNPSMSYALCSEALKLNPYNKDLWDLVAAHYVAETYDDKELSKIWKILYGKVKELIFPR